MNEPPAAWTDQEFDALLGHVLRAGVVLSALIVVCGAAVFLARHGQSVPDYRTFHGEPGDLRSVSGIFGDMRSGSGRGLIQLGLLVLIATPIARVAFSAAGFVRQRNWMYVSITLTVLMLLLYSLGTG